MAAWKDQMDEYLIVTETDRNKNFIIPSAYCVGSEIRDKGCLQKEYEAIGNGTTKFVSEEDFTNTESSLPADSQTGSRLNLTPSHPTRSSLPDCKNTLEPRTTDSYVDIATHTEHIQADNSAGRGFNGGQAESLSDDYSRVKDVNGDNVVFLEASPVYTSWTEKDYTDCAPLKNKKPPEPAPKEGTPTGFIDGGYIDTVPHMALM